MSLGALMGEAIIWSELEFRRERAMQQYNRRPRRHHKRHPAWPFARHASWARHSRPAVS